MTKQASTQSKVDPLPSGLAAIRLAVDWERIELDYRAGIKTLRQIADEHGITHGAINKRAKRDGWERDLTQKIHAKAEALVSKAAVSSEVSKEARAAEKLVIDGNAQAVADVRLGQRRDIQRARSLCLSLLEELELQTTRPELFEEIEQALAERPAGEQLSSAARSKLLDGMNRAMSLAGRSSTMRSLAESLRLLVGLERQAWGIKDEAEGGDMPGQLGGRELTDAERAVRMARMLAANPGALAAITGGAAA
ncbi:MAG: hypothetical protein LBE58_05235 [Comamonas sp.]|jgi:hypothetical protein|nr:hypothetical protein [Comamonas sp.]